VRLNLVRGGFCTGVGGDHLIQPVSTPERREKFAQRKVLFVTTCFVGVTFWLRGVMFTFLGV